MSRRVRSGVVVGSLVGIPVTFVLEVLGAGGAIWGSSELLGMRNLENKDMWDSISIAACSLALFRYAAKYCHESSNSDRHQQSFFGGFCHAVVAPHEAIKDEFLNHQTEATESTPLKSVVIDIGGRGF